MNDSPFRRIVLPALLASSAGFAVLTWPMASEQAFQMSERLPGPLGRWLDSALITHEHKEFSIRYIGFALLSSVAVGIGTAEVMRSRQGRLQRHQDLLNKMLAETTPTPPLEEPNLGSSAPGAVAMVDDGTVVGDAVASQPLDWSSLLSATPAAMTAEDSLQVTPINDHPLHHLVSTSQSRCLGLAVEGEYYRYYRNRPSLDKARSLVRHLTQQGKQSMATWDDAGYVVWVHEPEVGFSPISR
ncbi:hypothetical protein IQ254_15305 [Nodosilinea sp. LEGE 07088]|uniref:hypothetical protein n=1 Tax=Nodosilinea sp. LEGE 07088 TaxID=2777968 RepID=UPI00187F0631|nr:hypothetical protein [Nodosilinea sp. LEGE 07088]MBE9138541.1 hypothetical protein [Nodosilinea sp. LEGE 07088]